MVDILKILRYTVAFEQATEGDQTDSLLSFLWDGTPPSQPSTPVPSTVLPATGARQRVVQIAKSQIGQGAEDTWKKYLQGTVDSIPKTRIYWCGIFAVWVLQQAGLTSTKWEWGNGISSILKRTNSPQPGDILYIDKPYQHHAIIERIEGDRVHSIDGNSINGLVAPNDRPLSSISAFYSISPLIGEI